MNTNQIVTLFVIPRLHAMSTARRYVHPNERHELSAHDPRKVHLRPPAGRTEVPSHPVAFLALHSIGASRPTIDVVIGLWGSRAATGST